MLRSRLLRSLPLASAAYPVLPPAERRFALENRDRVTLGDARAFLASEGVHSELRAAFGTAASRTRLRRALDVFESQIQRWLAGDRQSRGVEWLVPAEEDAEPVIWRLYRALLESDDYATFFGLHELLRLPAAPCWTAFVSVSSIRLVRSVTRQHRIRLERAFSGGAASIGLPADARPWNSDHPLMSALPATWLYQFDPASSLSALIDRASLAGLHNVGHLAILDPALRATCSPKTAYSIRTAIATRVRLER